MSLARFHVFSFFLAIFFVAGCGSEQADPQSDPNIDPVQEKIMKDMKEPKKDKKGNVIAPTSSAGTYE